jgi:hypothetical protein
MQEKKDTFLDFSDRTDFLAEFLKLNLGDLPDLLGISRASFFSYRTGKRPLSKKAWVKLDALERKHGASRASPQTADLQSANAIVSKSPENQPDETVSQIKALEAKVELLTRMVETLLGQTKVRTMKQDKATSSPSLGDTIPAKKKTTIPKKLA